MSDQSQPENNVFILTLNGNELDLCINLNILNKQLVWSILQGNPNDLPINKFVRSLMDRGNTQESYEIWTIHVDHSVDEHEFKVLFNNNPKNSKGLIEKYGNLVYEK